MDNCMLLMIVAASTVVTEVFLLLNIHRFVKEPEVDIAKQGGQVSSSLGRVQILRLAIGISIIMLIAIFAVVLNSQGCLA